MKTGADNYKKLYVETTLAQMLPGNLPSQLETLSTGQIYYPTTRRCLQEFTDSRDLKIKEQGRLQYCLSMSPCRLWRFSYAFTEQCKVFNDFTIIRVQRKRKQDYKQSGKLSMCKTFPGLSRRDRQIVKRTRKALNSCSTLCSTMGPHVMKSSSCHQLSGGSTTRGCKCKDACQLRLWQNL